MKWALAQLNKIQMPYTFDESLDLSELVGFENIKSISNVNVRTTIKEYGIDTSSERFEIVDAPDSGACACRLLTSRQAKAVEGLKI